MVFHARRLYTGDEATRLALDLTLLPEGVFFLQEGVLYYAAQNTWSLLATAGSPVEGITFQSQGPVASYDPGSHTPPTDHWLLVGLDEGLYMVDDLGNLTGPLVTTGENLVPGTGSPKNIYINTLNGVMRFRPLVAGTNIDLVQYTDRIEVSANLLDTPISGTNLGTGGGATIYVDTVAASLRFNGVKGIEGLTSSNNTDAREIEIGLALPSLTGLSENLDPATDSVVVYNASASEHQKVLVNELLNPELYYGYETDLSGTPLDVEMTDAETWYALMKTATVWTEGYLRGGYATGSGGVLPPNYPCVQKFHVTLTGTFASGTTFEVHIGSPGVVAPGFTSLLNTNLNGSIVMHGIIETNNDTDLISVVAKNTSAGEHVYLYHMDVTIEKIMGI